MSVSIFLSYSHRDQDLFDKLFSHLIGLRRQGLITTWHDRLIMPGGEWHSEINKYFDDADIILLLISADYLASDYTYTVEMQRAIERHKAGEVVVIPVILRPVNWKDTPFSKLQVLPRNAKPITSWQDVDEAFFDVVRGIGLAAQQIIEVRKSKHNFFHIDQVGITNIDDETIRGKPDRKSI